MLPEQSTLVVVPQSQAMFRGQHYFLYYVSFVHSVQIRPTPYIIALITPSTKEQSAFVYSESKSHNLSMFN